MMASVIWAVEHHPIYIIPLVAATGRAPPRHIFKGSELIFVVVRQCPRWQAATKRWPLGARPRVRVMFVLAAASSMKTSRAGLNVLCSARQCARAWATSGRSCSASVRSGCASIACRNDWPCSMSKRGLLPDNLRTGAMPPVRRHWDKRFLTMPSETAKRLPKCGRVASLLCPQPLAEAGLVQITAVNSRNPLPSLRLSPLQ